MKWLKTLFSSKTGQVNAGKIQAIVVSAIMVMILFSVLSTVYPDVIQESHNLTSEMALLTTELGAAPAAFASNLTSYVGWFWVLAPFLLIISVALGILKLRKR